MAKEGCASCRKWLTRKIVYAWHGGIYCSMKCVFIAANATCEKERKIVRNETEQVVGSDIGITN